jgi:hypothetical protein
MACVGGIFWAGDGDPDELMDDGREGVKFFVGVFAYVAPSFFERIFFLHCLVHLFLGLF